MRRLLIANRGEIACRIARTARAMGIGTVAVHSEADRGAAHVAACDAAVEIGRAPAAESYLRGERILEAAAATGADAVHPGYGFLSENPDFAEAVVAAGLAWVGPPAAAIRAMGLKDEAKRRMEAAGVPVTPGYHGDRQEPAFLAARALEIGYPVLVKASAGGGGRGMRRVDRAEDFAEALDRARSEAEAAFSNPRVLIEKYVERPRHIEVQVFADADGRTVHLFERDCSAQRRHQKVIEEAPAPGMTDALRAAMTGAAVRAAEAVGYVGAGTVEFIVDGAAMAGGAVEGAFFFMEMNTRLQVEHPVTEAVTGIDLVEWQLRIARGEPLARSQAEIALSGHAVEARLYAEDPAQDFRPQTGRLSRLVLPGSVRVDSGVREGDTVTPHYDPMIAKLVAHGPDRAAAFARLSGALSRSHAGGVVTNLGFLSRLLADPDMAAGRLDTGLIGRAGDRLLAAPRATAADLALGAVVAAGLTAPDALTGWRPWGPGRSVVTLAEGDAPREIALTVSPLRGRAGMRIEAETPAGAVAIEAAEAGPDRWLVSDGGPALTVSAWADGTGVTLSRGADRLHLARIDPVEAAAEEDAAGDAVIAPLPGLVRAVSVAPGQAVAQGQTVAVLEAMKMEHALRAPRDGVVAEVLAAPGEPVAEGAVLVRLEADA